MKHGILLLVIAFASCGPSEGPLPTVDRPNSRTLDAGDSTDGGTSPDDVDGGSAADGGGTTIEPDSGRGDGPFRFDVPATSGSYDVDFTISISGSASDPIGDISVTGGAGTIEVDGRTAPVGLYERQQWDEFGYTLYQGIAVDEDRWWVVWFYCRDNVLTNVYYQGTAGPTIATVPANGTCDGTQTASTIDVDFPARTVTVDPLLDLFTVTATDLEIVPGEPGTFRNGGRDFEVYPFGHVDCTTECGPDGWHEIHVVLRDRSTNELCFAIFYLYQDMRYILVTYAFSLPRLTDPLPGSVRIDDGSWTE